MAEQVVVKFWLIGEKAPAKDDGYRGFQIVYDRQSADQLFEHDAETKRHVVMVECIGTIMRKQNL